jgi:hydrogenase small subunit
MPGFPDAFAPFYERPPGTFVSTTISKATGSIIRNLRNHTRFFNNRTRRWDEQGQVPNGWGNVREPNLIEKTMHYFYKKMQNSSSSSSKQ